MSVTDETNKVQEAGNGVKVAFDFDFKAFLATDLKVFEVDQATLVATELTITTHYTVSLNTITEGGTITYVTAPASGKDSFIKRELTFTQATDVDTEESIPAQSLNNEYDRSRMIDVQLKETLERALIFAETSALSGIVFPESTSASARALKIPAWDSDGTALELISISSVVNTDPIAVKGDMVQGNSAGEAEKLAIESTFDILQVVAGKAAWVTPTGSGAPVLETSPTLITPILNTPTINTPIINNPTITSPSSNDLTITGSAPSTPDANTITKDHMIGARCVFNGTGTPGYIDEINFSGSITDSGTGEWILTIDRDFAGATYTGLAGTGDGGNLMANVINAAAGAVTIICTLHDGTPQDDAKMQVVLIGAQ